MLLTDRWLAYLPHVNGPSGAISPDLVSGFTEFAFGPARLWVLPGKGARPHAGGLVRVIDTVPARHASASEWPDTIGFDDLQDALQVFTEIRETAPGTLSIAGDLISIRPVFLRRRAEGWWLSNRIELIRQVAPADAPVDRLAVLEFLILLSPMGRRTMEGGIERLFCGDRVEWSATTGPVLHAEGIKVRLGDPNPDAHPHMVAAQVKEAMFDSIRRKLAWHAGPPVIALSGGYDSRLMAAATRAMGHRYRAYTYGEPHHSEFWAARQIAERLGLDLRTVPYPHDMLRSRMPLYFEVLQGQIDPYVMHIANLLAMPETDGTAVMHGFLGDTMSGAFVCRVAPQFFRSKDALAEGIIRSYAFPNQLKAAEMAGFDKPFEQLCQSAYDNLPDAPHLFQSAMLWACSNRQRRFTSTQAEIIGSRFAPFYPFLDRAYMELWMHQPLMAQVDRTLFYTVFKAHFPEVATIPHPSSVFAIKPALKDILRKFARDRGLDAKEKLYKSLGRELPHPDIMRISYGGETDEIRRSMAAEVEAAAPALRSRFGIDVPQNLMQFCFPTRDLQYDGLHILRRFWTLARYVRWAEDAPEARLASAA
ncbi:asparagine synthase-related protein [Pedomonas mirosovicensis]|uniref:asparagine synthase-related protein n=1 Tax=Pedomonas mirosovicensis TaxID=2908641 RepID=UPI00216A7C3C|nr:asparagine synthase-related protein [Pedomonas mirosovicensis]MCH8683960.1 asparagine synthase-related protein [Pedomonas mirosovicensis]